jgi:hypothetical protein
VSQSFGFPVYLIFHIAFVCLSVLGSINLIAIFELIFHFITVLSPVVISILFFTSIHVRVVPIYSQLIVVIIKSFNHVNLDLKYIAVDVFVQVHIVVVMLSYHTLLFRLTLSYGLVVVIFIC